MTDDPFARWNLTPVINASGTMTSLGASRVAPETRALVDRILGSFVSMDELQARAGGIIARLTGAEAGCVTACSAAAMTQAVAACMTGADLARIEALPATDGEMRVILPMGHMVNYGAPVDQAIRLAGARHGTCAVRLKRARLRHSTSCRTTPCGKTNCRWMSSSRFAASMAYRSSSTWRRSTT